MFLLTRIAYARSLALRSFIGGNVMTNLRSALLFALAIIGITAAKASALTIDVCVSKANSDSTGNFFSAAAPIYPGGTIARSAANIDCSTITAAPVGTFFATGGNVAGLPGTDPKDVDLVTWHFRIGSRAFDTIGPVQNVGTGGTYPQTVVGSTFVPLLLNSRATVTALDPSGFAFEIRTTGF
jgi:hypothetical protein